MLRKASAALVLVVSSAASASAQVPVARFEGAAPDDSLGGVLAQVGDVDGDGRSDYAYASMRANGPPSDAGRVWVASGVEGTTLLALQGVAAGDEYGASVAAAGDVDADGHADLLVGARRVDAGGSDRGAVYVVSGLDGSTLAYVEGQLDAELFGETVAGLGDLTGDGVPDWAGASIVGDSGSCIDCGVVRIYAGPSGSFLYELHGLDDDDMFGSAVVSLGDLDGDGAADFAVGAPFDDVAGDRAGAVRIYSGQGGQPIYELLGYEPLSTFGSALAAAGDLDGDGYEDLLVAAPGEDSGGSSETGAVRAFSGIDGALLLEFHGQAFRDLMGAGLAGGEDFSGDGLPDILIGIPEEDPGSGRIEIYSGADGAWLGSAIGEAADDAFGEGVAFLGDLDGDGRSELFAGAPSGDPNGFSSGYALLFAACGPPVAYCDSKFNSLGCKPGVGFHGTPSLTGPDNFHVTASQMLSHQSGIAFFGLEPLHQPFQGGYLCVTPPLRRTGVQNSGGSPPPTLDCTGTYDLHFSQQRMRDAGLELGTSVYVQFWARDPNDPAGYGVSLSDALAFTICL